MQYRFHSVHCANVPDPARVRSNSLNQENPFLVGSVTVPSSPPLSPLVASPVPGAVLPPSSTTSTNSTMSTISFEDAMVTLRTMFPTYDDEVLTLVLQTNRGHMERSIDVLLQMDAQNAAALQQSAAAGRSNDDAALDSVQPASPAASPTAEPGTGGVAFPADFLSLGPTEQTHHHHHHSHPHHGSSPTPVVHPAVPATVPSAAAAAPPAASGGRWSFLSFISPESSTLALAEEERLHHNHSHHSTGTGDKSKQLEDDERLARELQRQYDIERAAVRQHRSDSVPHIPAGEELPASPVTTAAAANATGAAGRHGSVHADSSRHSVKEKLIDVKDKISHAVSGGVKTIFHKLKPGEKKYSTLDLNAVGAGTGAGAAAGSSTGPDGATSAAGAAYLVNSGDGHSPDSPGDDGEHGHTGGDGNGHEHGHEHGHGHDDHSDNDEVDFDDSTPIRLEARHDGVITASGSDIAGHESAEAAAVASAAAAAAAADPTLDGATELSTVVRRRPRASGFQDDDEDVFDPSRR